MGRYDRFTSAQSKPRPWRVHPVWRGIGCAMLIILPVMSYAGAVEIMRMNIERRWVALPAAFMKTVNIPYLFGVPHLFANLAVALLLLVIGYGILVILYSALYSMVGPKRSPLDAPPPKRPKKRRR
ncbi:MAG: hypothetical protein ISR60_07175 [Anaerolineales bacterium]|nr:hypothetical protein [Anaerolineales bacterium]